MPLSRTVDVCSMPCEPLGQIHPCLIEEYREISIMDVSYGSNVDAQHAIALSRHPEWMECRNRPLSGGFQLVATIL